MKITDDTPIVTLTVGQLKGLIESTHPPMTSSPKRVVYGLRGICDLFSCGLSRAQQLKNTVIADAVSQQGRTIVTDADMALELFQKASDNLK